MSGDLWGALDVRGYEIARFLLSLVWQSSILLLGVAALAFLLRRQPARVRHALWVVGLLCVPLLPLISWAGSKAGTPQRQVAVIPHYRAQFMPVSEPAHPALPASLSESPDETSRVPTPSLERQAPIPAPHLEPRAAAPAPLQPKQRARTYPWAWGIAAYAAATAALLAWVLFGWLGIRRRLRSGRVLNDARVAGILSSAQDQTGVGSCIAVIESTADSVPMTFGTFLPVILAPRGLLAGLSDEEVLALLVHELAHIRRRDAPTLMLVSLLRAVFFFQPLAWVAARRISILSEQAADDIVVEVTEQPVAYAKTLARLAEELPRRAIGIELSAGFIFSRGAFLNRVKAVLADRARVRKLSRWTLVGTVTGVLIVIGIACAVPMGEKRATVGTENPDLKATSLGGTAPEKPVRTATAAKPGPETILRLPAATDADLAALKDKQFLRELDLTGSQVTDGGLANLKEMKGLQKLDLARTHVTDDGLAHLREMKGLQQLNLSVTTVSDAALANLKGLTGLQHLDLARTNVTGTGLANLKEMTGLQSLDLVCAPVTDAGLANLKQMKGLQTLYLGGDKVTDAGLADLKELTGLQSLDLRGTEVTDAGLASLKQMKSLRVLFLDDTKVTDAGLVDLREMTGLKGLALRRTEVTDAGLANLKQITGLQNLYLGSTKVTDAGLADLKELKDLGWLELAGTQVTDAGLENLKEMKALWQLNLSSTQVTDAGLSTLKQMKSLDVLELARTQVTDAGLAQLKEIKRMRVLDLGGCNQITSAGLVNLKEMSRLVNLSLSNCSQLTDSALPYLKELGQMQQLDLGGTQVTAAGLADLRAALPKANVFYDHPAQAGQPAQANAVRAQPAQGTNVDLRDGSDADLAALKDVQQITSLDLSDSKVTDAGLALLKDMKDLQVLDLRFTKITPAGLAHVKEMKSLTNLVLQGTGVTDAGLTELKEMKTLDYLDLWGTKVTDAGLAQLKEMNGLTSLDLGKTLVTDAGLAQLKEIQGLKWLDLRWTQVTDAGLIDLKEMKGLQSLDLSRTRVTDAGIGLLKEMKGLEALYLSETKLTDAGLTNLEEIKGIQTLDLSDTQVTDAGLVDLKEMKNLKRLFLERTHLTAAGLADLKAALPQTQIQASIEAQPQPATNAPTPAEPPKNSPADNVRSGNIVRLRNAANADADLAALHDVQTIMTLLLNGSQVTDAGLARLEEMTGLQELDLTDCSNITDAALVHIKPLSNLRALSLMHTHVSDAGLVNLKDLHNLVLLILGNCAEITDNGLTSLKDISSLQELRLNNCSKVTNGAVAYLKEVKGLKQLDLRGTPVTAAALAELRTALPKTNILTDQSGQANAVRAQPAQGTNVDLRNGTDADLAALKNVEQITSFWISGRNVTDAGLARLEEMPNLERLNLGYCYSITDAALAHLKPLNKLRYLWIFGAEITDSGLANLKDLTQLELLDLNGCSHITDAALSYLAGLKGLNTIGLGGTQVKDAGVAQLAERTNLTSLLLRFTNVTDAGLACVKNLRLQVLDLRHCKGITDAGLANLKEMHSLYELFLDDTATTDAGLANLKGLVAMYGLSLNGCSELTDAGLASMKGMKKLGSLGLSECPKITDVGLANLKDMSDLQYLDLRGTKVTAEEVTRLKAALPRIRIESGALPSELSRQVAAPAAVTKALKAEWPEADIRVVNQVDNYPGWEPKKLWRAAVAVKPGSFTQVAVTGAGLVARVVTSLNAPDAGQALPKAVADAVAAAVPGGKCDIGSRRELRLDKTGAKLPKPVATYQLQVSGPEAIVGLSVAEDGSTVKTVWKTPPAVFKTLSTLISAGKFMVTPMRLPIKSMAAGWMATGAKDGGNMTARVTEDGDVVTIITTFGPAERAKGLPKAVTDAAAAVIPAAMGRSVFVSSTETRMDENMVKLAPPQVIYQLYWPGGQLFLTEAGVVTKSVTQVDSAVPKAVEDVVAKTLPGWTIRQWQRTETRIDDKMVKLPAPVVQYDMTLRRGESDGSNVASISLTEAGVVTSVMNSMEATDLPKAVAESAAAALPGRVISRVMRSEARMDKKMVILPEPNVKYIVVVSDGETSIRLVLSEDGKVAEKSALPATWNVFGW